jgi:hypothetical protein
MISDFNNTENISENSKYTIEANGRLKCKNTIVLANISVSFKVFTKFI